MTRRRSPQNDFICQLCGCACTSPDALRPRHLGGGSRAMKACGKPPRPILRSEHEAEIKAIVAGLGLRRNWPGE